MTTLTTLGTGEFYPVGNTRFIASIEAITGFFLFSVIAGLIAGSAYDVIREKRAELK